MLTIANKEDKDRKPKYFVMADNELNPHRFETLSIHIDFGRILIRKNMGIGPLKRLDVEQEIEIFASYLPSESQIDTLRQGLVEENISPLIVEVQDVIKASEQIVAILKQSENPVSGIFGFGYKNQLTIVAFPLKKEALELTGSFLKYFFSDLDCKYENIYMEELSKNHDAIELLSRLGFHHVQFYRHGPVTLWIEREKLKTSFEKLFLEPVPAGFSCEMSKIEEFEQSFSKVIDEENESEALKGRFGVFVQNEEKQMLGGGYCEVQEKEHLYLEYLWLHKVIRGKKLSKEIVKLAEHHAREIKCIDSSVESSSRAAHWLYPRLGYQRTSSIPFGSYESYTFKKSL